MHALASDGRDVDSYVVGGMLREAANNSAMQKGSADVTTETMLDHVNRVLDAEKKHDITHPEATARAHEIVNQIAKDMNSGKFEYISKEDAERVLDPKGYEYGNQYDHGADNDRYSALRDAVGEAQKHPDNQPQHDVGEDLPAAEHETAADRSDYENAA